MGLVTFFPLLFCFCFSFIQSHCRLAVPLKMQVRAQKSVLDERVSALKSKKKNGIASAQKKKETHGCCFIVEWDVCLYRLLFLLVL